MSWTRQQPDTELVYELGSEYPVAIICTIFEENTLGERRLVEQKTLSISKPSSDQITKSNPAGYMHGVECSRKGKVTVFHFSDCEGGEKCALFKYLAEDGVPEKHLSRGYEYWVKRDDTGAFVFTDKRKL